jgi:hypothetical protein
MKRHTFDSVSFLAGVILLALSVPFLFTDVRFRPAEGRWIVPGILIIAGVVMLGAGWGHGEAEHPEPITQPAIDEAGGDDVAAP